MKNLLIVSLMAVSVLAACASSTPAPATSAPTTVPPTTAPPTSAPTATEFAPDAKVIQTTSSLDYYPREAQASGKYKTPGWFPLAFTFELKKPFRGGGERNPNGDMLGLGRGDTEFPAHTLVFFTFHPDHPVEEVISKLRATPEFQMTPNQTVNVVGSAGHGYFYFPKFRVMTLPPRLPLPSKRLDPQPI